MMRKMIETVKGSPDGINVREFKEGEVYDLPEKLAIAFDSMGVCEVLEKAAKSAGEAPANKMAEKPKADKSDDIDNKEDKGKSQKSKRRRNS